MQRLTLKQYLNEALTEFEINKLQTAFRRCGGYRERMFQMAKAAFLNGTDLDTAIRDAKKKFSFEEDEECDAHFRMPPGAGGGGLTSRMRPTGDT